MRSLGLFACLAASLAGCGGAVPPASSVASATAKVNTTIARAQSDLQGAVTLYGIAKGIAEVGALADPDIAPILTGITALADPVVADAQTVLTDATADTTQIEALVAQITAQADALTVKAAPVVTVVANAPATPS